MNPRLRVALVAALLVAGLAALIAGRMANRPPRPEPTAFAQQVDLTPLAQSAVHARGRLKSFHSFSDMMMTAVSGPHGVGGQRPEFTYLDMMLRPGNTSTPTSSSSRTNRCSNSRGSPPPRLPARASPPFMRAA